MALFGLFEKKICDFCGAKIGLLGNRKLADGNMCKECARPVSPYLADQRQLSVEKMKEHLQYREENKAKVAAFHTTRTLGRNTKVYLDEDKKQLIISSSRRWEESNPDVLDFSQITGCDVDIDENKEEIYQEEKDESGKKLPYDPPRYSYSYDFTVHVQIRSPWFQEISFDVADGSIENKHSTEYREIERLAAEICRALSEVRSDVRSEVAAANAPKASRTCPRCGATTVPDASGRCEYCGASIDG